VITYIHNTRGERHWKRQLADRLLGRFATDRFVAVSRQVHTCLMHQVPAAADKTTLLYHAVAPERLQRPADYAREQFRHQEGIQVSHFLVTAIGRAVYEKGFDLLLTAFARVYAAVPEARLLIAGDGGMLPELEVLIDRLRLRSCVRLLGYRDDIPSLLTASDVFVLPSRQEGFGLAALEAMALGVPVVLTEAAPITEVLTHGETGWIIPCSPADIADGILALYHDAATRHRMSCQAKALFEQDLTMTAYAQKMGRIIDETVMR
jgi:glycosyltransferase involved in cell wall biosynthesis